MSKIRTLVVVCAILAAWASPLLAQQEFKAVEPSDLLANPQYYWAKGFLFRDVLAAGPGGKALRYNGKTYEAVQTKALGTCYVDPVILHLVKDLPLNRTYIFRGTVLQTRRPGSWFFSGKQYLVILSGFEATIDVNQMSQHLQTVYNRLDQTPPAGSTAAMTSLLEELQLAMAQYARNNKIEIDQLFRDDPEMAKKTIGIIYDVLNAQEAKLKTTSSEILASYLLAFIRAQHQQPPPNLPVQPPATPEAQPVVPPTEPPAPSVPPATVTAPPSPIEPPPPVEKKSWWERRREASEKRAQESAEKARIANEEKAQKAAEEKARKEEERKAKEALKLKREAEKAEKARLASEQNEAERKALEEKKQAEKKAAEEKREQARLAREEALRKQAEEKARREEERKAAEELERQKAAQKAEAERLAAEQEEAERRAAKQAEEERLAQEAALKKVEEPETPPPASPKAAPAKARPKAIFSDEDLNAPVGR